MSTDNTPNDPKQEVLSDDAAKVEDEIKKTQNSVVLSLILGSHSRILD